MSYPDREELHTLGQAFASSGCEYGVRPQDNAFDERGRRHISPYSGLIHQIPAHLVQRWGLPYDKIFLTTRDPLVDKLPGEQPEERVVVGFERFALRTLQVEGQDEPVTAAGREITIISLIRDQLPETGLDLVAVYSPPTKAIYTAADDQYYEADVAPPDIKEGEAVLEILRQLSVQPRQGLLS